MEALAIILGLAGLAWGTLFVLRVSVPVGCALFLISTCCFSNDFFEFNLGIGWTLDRVVLVLLLAAFAVQWRLGRLEPKPLTRSEWLLFGFVGLLAISTFTHDWRTVEPGESPIVQHLLNGYIIPLMIFLLARNSRITPATTRAVGYVLAAFGVYLAGTAIAEITHQWWAVFPGYMADPKRGIHFGRARGPMLQSGALGMYLVACLLATWLVTYSSAGKGWWRWILAACLVPLYLAATWFTYTRICWIGMGLAVGTLVFATLRGSARNLVIAGALLASTCLLVAKWDSFVAFQREDSAAVTRESTFMRACFAYVSWEMFQDRPLWGFGFGQFSRANRPYLTEPNTALRLEWIRGYVHHNTYLGMLVDLGLIGFVPFVLLMAHWLIAGWQVWRRPEAPPYMKAQGLVLVASMLPYLAQMMFHDLSYTPAENALVYLFAGTVSGMQAMLAAPHATAGTPQVEQSHKLVA